MIYLYQQKDLGASGAATVYFDNVQKGQNTTGNFTTTTAGTLKITAGCGCGPGGSASATAKITKIVKNGVTCYLM